MKMTYNAYDKMLERFEKMETNPYYPDPLEIEEMEKDPDKFLLFVCYLYENGRSPASKEEEYSRKNLKEFIDRHLVLVDDGTVKIEVRSAGNGTATVEKTDYKPGADVLITATPDAGYHVAYAEMLDGMFEKSELGHYRPELDIKAPDMDAVIIVHFER